MNYPFKGFPSFTKHQKDSAVMPRRQWDRHHIWTEICIHTSQSILHTAGQHSHLKASFHKRADASLGLRKKTTFRFRVNTNTVQAKHWVFAGTNIQEASRSPDKTLAVAQLINARAADNLSQAWICAVIQQSLRSRSQTGAKCVIRQYLKQKMPHSLSDAWPLQSERAAAVRRCEYGSADSPFHTGPICMS